MLKNVYIGFIYFLFFAGVVSVEINNFYFYAESEFTEHKKETLFRSSKKNINHFKNNFKTDLNILSQLFADKNLKESEQKMVKKENSDNYKKTLRDTKKPPKKRKSNSSKDSKKRIKKSKSIAFGDSLLYSPLSTHRINKRSEFFFSELHSEILIPPPKICRYNVGA